LRQTISTAPPVVSAASTALTHEVDEQLIE
jgi:hypothetical protein